MTMRLRSLMWLAVAGCGPSVAVSPGGESSGTEAETSSDGDAEGGDAEGGDVGDGSSDTEGSVDETGAPPACGDGVVDANEACDDGDAVFGNGCNPDCQTSGTPLWTATITPTQGGDSLLQRVAISADGIVLGGAMQYADDGTARAELNAYSLTGAPLWQTPTEGEETAVSGLVVGPTGLVSMLFAKSHNGFDTGIIGTYTADGSLIALSFGGDFNEGFPIGLAIDGAGMLIYAGLAATQAENPWLSAHDQAGGDIWLIEPSDIPNDVAGLAVGGVYVASYGVGSDDAQVQRFDSGGALLWTTAVACGGALAVAADDTVAAIVSESTTIGICRVTPDGTALARIDVEVGERFTTAVASTDAGDLILGGYTNPDTQPWIGRISVDGVLQWVHEPPTDGSTAFVQSVAVDEAQGVVAAGMALSSQNGTLGQLIVLTP